MMVRLITVCNKRETSVMAIQKAALITSFVKLAGNQRLVGLADLIVEYHSIS
jgi:hypothetical protein